MADRSFFGGRGEEFPAWMGPELMDEFAGASILLIEDDPDIRELLATLLRLAGFDPTVCGSAEVGLEQLREQPFDLVLTDYALPNRTGGWLIRQAKAEGLLEATPVLVVTAHPSPPDVEGCEVIPKPFDLDDLVARVKQRLDGGARRRPAPPPAGSKPPRPGDTDGDCPGPVELILYVSADSPRSAAAIRNITRALARFQSSRVKLTIYDLSRQPEAGKAEAAAFTPTLARRSPGPRTFILGHLTNPNLLVELIRACGEDVR